jgi:hypothetical protein
MLPINAEVEGSMGKKNCINISHIWFHKSPYFHDSTHNFLISLTSNHQFRGKLLRACVWDCVCDWVKGLVRGRAAGLVILGLPMVELRNG